jgi:hypothetical protein
MPERIFSADQLKVPTELPRLLRDFAKEVIRSDPSSGKEGPEARAAISEFAIKWFENEMKKE